MAKKISPDTFPIQDLGVLENGYLDSIDNDVRYSVEVDPLNKYNFSDTQKEFILNYVQFKNIPLAAKLSDIEEELAIVYYNNFNIKMEIRRINLALYHRAFATRMMGIDEIGGYLTSVLIGENLAEADKIGTRDKLQVAKMLIDLNKIKQESLSNPDKIINAVDIQEDLSSLSVDTIQKLITSSKRTTKETKEKNELVDEINEVNNDGLSLEEINHLKTLPTSELLKILEETNKVTHQEEKKSEEISKENLEKTIEEMEEKLEEDGELEEETDSETPQEETPVEKMFKDETIDEASGESYSINSRIKEFFEKQNKRKEEEHKNGDE